MIYAIQPKRRIWSWTSKVYNTPITLHASRASKNKDLIEVSSTLPRIEEWCIIYALVAVAITALPYQWSAIVSIHRQQYDNPKSKIKIDNNIIIRNQSKNSSSMHNVVFLLQTYMIHASTPELFKLYTDTIKTRYFIFNFFT